jgi:Putative peptidoglycan binding domain
MRHKALRLFTVLICCLVIPLVASAAKDNKKKKQGQQQQQAQRQVQPGGKHQNAGNPNKANKGKQGFNNPNKPNNANIANKGNKANKGKQGFNNPNKPNNANIANKGNKANKGKQGFNNPNNPNNANIANKGNKANKGKQGFNNPNNPNNPNIANKGKKGNKGNWQAKHYNFSNNPNPKIQSVKFQKNYHIHGAQNWKGAHYAAFRNYNSEWHDRSWWNRHYNRVVFIGGGWYAWNGGWWYPAWGYNPAQTYYPYNGPIYAYRGLPPDQVIANVQAELQQQGYYRGEVDGLLGPLTREALIGYQNTQGLAPTGSIDQPTLYALGMS